MGNDVNEGVGITRSLRIPFKLEFRRAVHPSLKLALAGKREQRAGCLG